MADSQSDEYIDPSLKPKLVEELKRKGEMSMLDIQKRADSKMVRFALADLYNHGYLYSQIKRTPDSMIATTDKLLYRVFYVTEKFYQAVEKGEKIE